MRAQTWSLISAVLVLVLALSFQAVAATTKVADKDTVFHRVYIQGCGKNADQEASYKDDIDDLREDLEDSDNQAAGSTSWTAVKPYAYQIRDYLNHLKTVAKPGEEVTFFFAGHGSGSAIWLNWGNDMGDKSDDEWLWDHQLAEWLEGFEECVTIVVILDTCYGGGFADDPNDLQETDHLSLVACRDETYCEPNNIFRGFHDTFAEDVEDGAGDQDADENEDGTVTAEELKKWLRDQGWDTGTGVVGIPPTHGKGNYASPTAEYVLPVLFLDNGYVIGENLPGTIVTLLLYTEESPRIPYVLEIEKYWEEPLVAPIEELLRCPDCDLDRLLVVITDEGYADWIQLDGPFRY